MTMSSPAATSAGFGPRSLTCHLSPISSSCPSATLPVAVCAVKLGTGVSARANAAPAVHRTKRPTARSPLILGCLVDEFTEWSLLQDGKIVVWDLQDDAGHGRAVVFA